jgi:hypothetical protein
MPRVVTEHAHFVLLDVSAKTNPVLVKTASLEDTVLVGNPRVRSAREVPLQAVEQANALIVLVAAIV